MPTSVLSNIFSNYPSAKISIRYRYKYIGDNVWFPRSGQGTDGYYIENYNCGFQYIAPKATIEGDDFLVSEQIYYIKNVVSIDVINEDGSANHKVTYSNVGGNQWRITRVGNSVGKFVIKATNIQNVASTKTVTLGYGAPVISGSNLLETEGTYTIRYGTEIQLLNATGKATLSNLGNNQYKITKTDHIEKTVIIKAVNSVGIVSAKSVVISGIVSYSVYGYGALGLDDGTYFMT